MLSMIAFGFCGSSCESVVAGGRGVVGLSSIGCGIVTLELGLLTELELEPWIVM